jgi:hypothetical protein
MDKFLTLISNVSKLKDPGQIAFRIRLDFYPRLSTFQDMIFQVPILGLLPCFPTSAF